jgi:hypothetical protein
MYKYKFSFLAISRQFEFVIKTLVLEDLYQFLDDLFIVFSKFDEEEQQSVLDFKQNTPELYAEAEKIVAKYSKDIPQINGLTAYLRSLRRDEYFYFLPDIEVQSDVMSRINAFLISKSEGKEFEEVYDAIKEYWELRDTYSIKIYGNHRTSIGEPIKENRVCRFCSQRMGTVTFNDKAHAISEALGNKNVILFDECDQCNSRFSKTIEPDIVLFLSLFRTFFKIKGKDGVKDFKGKKFHVTNKDQLTIKFSWEQDSKPFSLPYKLKFQPDSSITKQNIYKSFCKYFLSVIDSVELVHFKNTIEWINGKIEIQTLPRVAELMSYGTFTHQPKLTTCIRKNDDGTLPYAIGEFRFAIFVYVFIVPLCSKDEDDFINDESYNRFWHFFKVYGEMGKWGFHNLSPNIPGNFELTLNFKSDREKP